MEKNLEKYVKGLFLKHGKKIRFKVKFLVIHNIGEKASKSKQFKTYKKRQIFFHFFSNR